MIRSLLIVAFISTAALFHPLTAQNKANPVSYNNVLWSGQVAQFSFEDLGDREIISSKKMSFFADQRIEMDFRVKIKPDGSVSYVKAPRVPAQLHEYRLGGSSALYSYQFSPSEDSESDQWVSVRMVVGE